MRKLLFLSLLLVLISSGCREISKKRIRGNGNIKTETRSLGQFSNIHVSGAIDVYLRFDSVTTAKVEADENLLGYIRIDNNNGTLEIEEEDGINLRSSRGIKVYISGPTFRKLAASGACDIFSENQIVSNETIDIDLSGASDIKIDVKAPKIKAELSGAGTITLKGETKDLVVDGSGSTDIRCFELMTENTFIEISGAGSAEVFASVKLDVRVSGAGSVKYKGTPTVNQSISGAGSVKKVD